MSEDHETHLDVHREETDEEILESTLTGAEREEMFVAVRAAVHDTPNNRSYGDTYEEREKYAIETAELMCQPCSVFAAHVKALARGVDDPATCQAIER